MWRGLPYIVRRSDRVYRPIDMVNGPGARPYIAGKTELQWTWNEWECPVAEIKFEPEEVEYAKGFHDLVIIEPNVKDRASPNKNWGRERWTELAGLLGAKGLKPVQLGSYGTQIIPGAKLIVTPTFRHACAVLARARVAILPEGGLHHAAAALAVPSVVIFGGYISPKQTGYASQVNLFTGEEPCGMRTPCKHCAAAMAAITPEMVLEKATGLLNVRA